MIPSISFYSLSSDFLLAVLPVIAETQAWLLNWAGRGTLIHFVLAFRVFSSRLGLIVQWFMCLFSSDCISGSLRHRKEWWEGTCWTCLGKAGAAGAVASVKGGWALGDAGASDKNPPSAEGFRNSAALAEGVLLGERNSRGWGERNSAWYLFLNNHKELPRLGQRMRGWEECAEITRRRGGCGGQGCDPLPLVKRVPHWLPAGDWHDQVHVFLSFFRRLLGCNLEGR